MINQEEAGQIVASDQLKLLIQPRSHLLINVPIATAGRFLAEAFQPRLGVVPRRNRAVRIGITSLEICRQLEIRAAFSDDEGVPDCLGMRPEKLRHDGGRFQVKLPVDLEPLPDVRQRGVQAHCGKCVVQVRTVRVVIPHLVGRDSTDAATLRQFAQSLVACDVAVRQVLLQLHEGAAPGQPMAIPIG